MLANKCQKNCSAQISTSKDLFSADYPSLSCSGSRLSKVLQTSSSTASSSFWGIPGCSQARWDVRSRQTVMPCGLLQIKCPCTCTGRHPGVIPIRCPNHNTSHFLISASVSQAPMTAVASRFDQFFLASYLTLINLSMADF